MRIHINAGHGGKDPGACGKGLKEKDITLTTALLLGSELTRKGFEVSYTRVSDTYFSPYEIADRANNDNSDLFISIHTNSVADISVSGIETLIYKKGGKEDQLADNIQKELIKTTGFKDRGVKERPDLIVLNSTKMSAVLIELGFISCVSDSFKLKKQSFLQSAAEAICKGVCQYYGIDTKESNPLDNIPDWQRTGFENLVSGNVITDKDYWVNKLNDGITVGEVLGLLGNML